MYTESVPSVKLMAFRIYTTSEWLVAIHISVCLPRKKLSVGNYHLSLIPCSVRSSNPNASATRCTGWRESTQFSVDRTPYPSAARSCSTPRPKYSVTKFAISYSTKCVSASVAFVQTRAASEYIRPAISRAERHLLEKPGLKFILCNTSAWDPKAPATLCPSQSV